MDFKIILRNLFRKGWEYSWINIAGLAVSLTVIILIMLWVWDEMSFDRFHHRSKDIYQTNVKFKIVDEYWNLACGPLAFAAKNEIPEVENACRGISFWRIDMLQNREQNKTVADFSCGIVDSTFFSVFDFKVLEGDLRRLLVDYESIVLSESIARQLFGVDNPFGAVLFDNHHRQYRVSGVMADMPQNSSLRFDILLPFTFFERMDPQSTKDWTRANYHTWFLLQPRANPAVVEGKIAELVNRHVPDDLIRYSLQPLESLNFYNADGSANSKAQTNKMFSFIALALIFVACINYVNITTARASCRNKEVFMRNILGARKLHLFFQFLKESTFLFVISLAFAICLLYLFFPAFNNIAGKQMVFRLFSIPTMVVFGLTFLTVVICAGIYPAINLAVRKPLQGIGYKRSNTFLRRTLVVTQFVVATVLISVTITTGRQLEFIKHKDLGYEKENVLCVPIGGISGYYNTIKTELLRNPAILNVTVSSQPLNNIPQFLQISEFEGSEVDQLRTILLRTDSSFFSTMNIPLVSGRGFDASSYGNNVILNETAVKSLNISDPIGRKCMVGNRECTVIGVVRDFHIKNLYYPIEPLVLSNETFQRNFLYVRTTNNGVSQAINAVQSLWLQYNPQLPFSYHFIDDNFKTEYITDIRSGIIFQIFAIVAILLSCFGLFGLVTFAAETKTKEIAIRKVMGANVSSIVYMLSREFMILACIGMLIAFPLAYHWLDRFLQDYAYRINVNFWIFAWAGIITVALTMLTVGWKALKAALANPVEAINS